MNTIKIGQILYNNWTDIIYTSVHTKFSYTYSKWYKNFNRVFFKHLKKQKIYIKSHRYPKKGGDLNSQEDKIQVFHLPTFSDIDPSLFSWIVIIK